MEETKTEQRCILQPPTPAQREGAGWDRITDTTLIAFQQSKEGTITPMHPTHTSYIFHSLIMPQNSTLNQRSAHRMLWLSQKEFLVKSPGDLCEAVTPQRVKVFSDQRHTFGSCLGRQRGARGELLCVCTAKTHHAFQRVLRGHIKIAS